MFGYFGKFHSVCTYYVNILTDSGKLSINTRIHIKKISICASDIFLYKCVKFRKLHSIEAKWKKRRSERQW